jgi:peptidoglycan hydrolase-like protein with peptidoglycan-binding domain
MFAPEPNGRYDADTTAALRAFQRDQQLPETGLPDQITLAKLL